MRKREFSPAFFFTLAGILILFAVLQLIFGLRSWWAYLGLGAALLLRGLTKRKTDIKSNSEGITIEAAAEAEEPSQWAKNFETREAERMEAHRKTMREVCEKLGICEEDIPKIKEDGYRRNYYDGVYHCDHNAPYCSIDNPREIGMEGCCTTLVFLAELGGWCLTDGLGNGWLR